METEQESLESQLAYYQAKLSPFAYNIVGDSMEAQDLVQEVLNNYLLKPNKHIEKVESYLTRAVINKAINRKQLLRNRLESYPGSWLPTPICTEESIYTKVDRNQILSYSLLVLLERLNPKERAVFILKESFDYSHDEIGSILNVKTENSRQLLKRGKQKLEGETITAPTIPHEESSQILNQLTKAILSSDMDKVKSLLYEDIKTTSDGGPKVSAARNILYGHKHVGKLLQAIYGKYLYEGTISKFITINHLPAIIYTLHGKIYRCILFEISASKIKDVYVIVNPDKLKNLNIQLNVTQKS